MENSKYFFALDEMLFVNYAMFLFFTLNNAPFLYRFIFIGPSVCHSSFNMLSRFNSSDYASRNFNWPGGFFHLIPTVIGFVFCTRRSIKIFSI